MNEIAEFINTLNEHKVSVYIDNDIENNYTGNVDRVYGLGIKFKGIKKSITNKKLVLCRAVKNVKDTKWLLINVKSV